MWIFILFFGKALYHFGVQWLDSTKITVIVLTYWSSSPTHTSFLSTCPWRASKTIGEGMDVTTGFCGNNVVWSPDVHFDWSSVATGKRNIRNCKSMTQCREKKMFSASLQHANAVGFLLQQIWSITFLQLYCYKNMPILCNTLQEFRTANLWKHFPVGEIRL